MEIKINEIKFTIREATEENKHPNLLAYVSVTLKEESGGYLTMSGFTFWKSKYSGYNVAVPSKPGFKYFLGEKPLWRKIKKEIINQFEYESIPIIESKE